MTLKNFRYRYPRFLAWGIFFFANLCFHNTHANKVLVKTWDAQSIQSLEILAENAYGIELSTHKGAQIRVEAHMEGEHSEQIILNSIIEEGILRLRPGYQEYFHRPNDKLAAHKVISISLVVKVPEQFRVFISAPKAHLEGEGTFENLIVHLGTGNCRLKKFQGDAELQTTMGFIDVEAFTNTSGIALSHKGKVLNDLPSQGFYRLKAESVKGDISLRKTPD